MKIITLMAKHPMVTAGVALGVGMIVGYMVGCPRKA